MKFETKHIDDVIIFKLVEKRLDTSVSGLFKGELTELLKDKKIIKLIIDLSKVESCDSSGLSAILVANRLVQSVNGQLRIAEPSEKVYTLIRITQLDKVLPISQTVEEAFKDLQSI